MLGSYHGTSSNFPQRSPSALPPLQIGEAKSDAVRRVYRGQASVISVRVDRFQRNFEVVSREDSSQKIVVLVGHHLRHHPPLTELQHLCVELRACVRVELLS
jgi:hypothetical protein